MDGEANDGRGAPGRFRWRRAARATLALGLAAALPLLAGNAQPTPRPALWLVGDADTTIYLFGTFHALDGKADWYGSVRGAFERSDSLVLETLAPDALVTAGPAPQGARQAIAAGRSAGMRVELGADAVLRRAADALGKPVEGLERFEQQIAMYRQLAAPVPAPAAQSAPQPTAQSADKAAALAQLMTALQDAWNRGDASQFESVVEALSKGSPAAYQAMFADRNANWAAWIGKRLETPGTVFVAVGTGHLVGRDSVQAKLAERGIRSDRIG